MKTGITTDTSAAFAAANAGLMRYLGETYGGLRPYPTADARGVVSFVPPHRNPNSERLAANAGYN